MHAPMSEAAYLPVAVGRCNTTIMEELYRVEADRGNAVNARAIVGLL